MAITPELHKVRMVMNDQQTPFKRLIEAGIQLAAWGFFCLGLFCFFMVSLMIYNGDVWAYIIYVAKPFHNILSGIGLLFAWYLLRGGVHNTRDQWKRFGARMLLLAFSIAFSLIAAEIVLRAYYSAVQNANSIEHFKAARKNGKPMQIHSSHPLATIIQPSDDQKLVYELQPHLDMIFGPERVRVNAEGMRKDRDYPVGRLPNSVRIVGIGDSGMFGWDVEQNKNYMDMLESNLNKRADGTVYEALNFGVPGYNTQLEIEMLRCKGLKYKPDIVIVGWCENDYSLPMFLMEKDNYWTLKKSFLYRLLFKRGKMNAVAPGFQIRDLREYDNKQVLPELMTGTDPAGVKNALVELKKLGEQQGFKLLIFGPMKELICQICEDLGISYACTYKLIPNNKYPAEYLVHFMHPKKEGHAVLAEYLEQDLVRRGWLPAPAKQEK